MKQQVLHPPAILRWDPARASVDWRLETGSILGAYMDDEGWIYLVERDNLTILDEQSGEVLNLTELKDMPASGPKAGHPIQIGRKGNRLYLRNHALGSRYSPCFTSHKRIDKVYTSDYTFPE